MRGWWKSDGARIVPARRGEARLGGRGRIRQGVARRGKSWRSRNVRERFGEDRQGGRGLARRGSARLGQAVTDCPVRARQGVARRGGAVADRQGTERRGKATLGGCGLAVEECRGLSGRVLAWRSWTGEARRVLAGLGGCGLAGRSMSRPGGSRTGGHGLVLNGTAGLGGRGRSWRGAARRGEPRRFWIGLFNERVEQMAKVKAKVVESVAIEIESLKTGRATVWLRGKSPLILNRMAGKALRELLAPKGRKTTAEKQQTLKHDPMAEYRNSMSVRDGTGPTRIIFPCSAVKSAMATSALETKGTSKAQIGRLVWVENMTCDLYGVPKLLMSVVRSADMNRTPDVRTRAILPEWCLEVTIQYVRPQMSEQTLFQLLANAGVVCGIGDFRQEKGKGNFGQFEIATDKDCKAIVASGGIKQQDAAIKEPKCFDADTEELLSWFIEEVGRRGKSSLLAGAA